MRIKAGQYLIIDPCYIKKVTDGSDIRYDALKLIKSWDVDDGAYELVYSVDMEDERLSCSGELGVDSGRIWLLRAEFDCEVETDSGFSGELVVIWGLVVDSVSVRGIDE